MSNPIPATIVMPPALVVGPARDSRDRDADGNPAWTDYTLTLKPRGGAAHGVEVAEITVYPDAFAFATVSTRIRGTLAWAAWANLVRAVTGKPGTPGVTTCRTPKELAR